MKCEYSWMIRAIRLRLGMPATVRIRLERGDSHPSSADG